VNMKSNQVMAMAVAVLLGCSGCATSMTLERAKGEVWTNNVGEVKVVRQPAPECYLLLPLAVPFDLAVAPFIFVGGMASFAITGHLPY